MVDILGLYRRIPAFLALVLATIGAGSNSVECHHREHPNYSRILDHWNQSDLAAGILVITAIPNIIVPSFIVALTLLVNLHGRASWKTPTLAFLIGAIATWKWVEPFGIAFAPAVLGVAMIAWGISCFMLYWKGMPTS